MRDLIRMVAAGLAGFALMGLGMLLAFVLGGALKLLWVAFVVGWKVW